MSDFWNNLSRYPRFFISSMVGLILVILAPLKNLLKVPKLRIILIISILLLFSLLYFVIKNMAAL
uniref:Uncharacterized protein ycf33 n=1 Tax=Kryptoperidinium foliaceum TaxID=160619 RepID=D7PJC0_9DINO|nr:hypothetical protein KrfoC_p025 [Kryptoperidinium foliaceum]ADI40320.1 conserved hypothetical protein [Kryptoperidinium foliaceum]